MKQEHNQPYTILDAEYQVIDGTERANRSAQSGGMNLLLSVFMFVNPVISWFAWTTVWGIYLLTAAIALLVTLWSARRRPHTSSAV